MANFSKLWQTLANYGKLWQTKANHGRTSYRHLLGGGGGELSLFFSLEKIYTTITTSYRVRHNHLLFQTMAAGGGWLEETKAGGDEALKQEL